MADDRVAVFYIMHTCHPILRLLRLWVVVVVVPSLLPSLFDQGDM